MRRHEYQLLKFDEAQKNLEDPTTILQERITRFSQYMTHMFGTSLNVSLAGRAIRRGKN